MFIFSVKNPQISYTLCKKFVPFPMLINDMRIVAFSLSTSKSNTKLTQNDCPFVTP